MTTLLCPKCESWMDIDGDLFSKLNEIIICDICKSNLQLDYDSYWEEGAEDSYGEFNLHLRESL